MWSYDLPQTEGLSPEEARAVLDTIHADAAGDREHPYTDQHHPQHARFVQAVTRLYEARNSPAELGSPLSDEEQADLGAQIATLQSTPGYINGKLRHQSLSAYNRLVGKIHALYERAAQGRQAAEREAAQAAEIDRDAVAEEAAETELARAVERVKAAEDAERAAEEVEETEDDDGNEL